MSAITEIEEILSLLEAQIPANPRSAKNEQKAKSLEKDLREYFESLEDAFPYDELESFYYGKVK